MFSSDDNRFVTSSRDGLIIIWEDFGEVARQVFKTDRRQFLAFVQYSNDKIYAMAQDFRESNLLVLDMKLKLIANIRLSSIFYVCGPDWLSNITVLKANDRYVVVANENGFVLVISASENRGILVSYKTERRIHD